MTIGMRSGAMGVTAVRGGEISRRRGGGLAARFSTAVAALLPALCGALGAETFGIPFHHLSRQQGLSQATVNCFLQDRTGFLWIGTQDGLNRYDGYGFRVYKTDPTDPRTLPANWIEALAEDEAGDLWIGTLGGGLARWRRATGAFERVALESPDPSRPPSSRVTVLLFDRGGAGTGHLWAGTLRSGLVRLVADGTVERFRHDPADPGSLADDRVRAVHGDRAGNLWVGTLSGLDLYDRVAGSFRHFRHDPADPTSLSDDRVKAIHLDHRGALWVGTEKGLNRRDPGASGFERYLHDPADPASLSHDHVRAILEDRSRRLWVGTDGGLSLLLRPGGGFVRYRHDPGDPRSLAGDRVLALYEDRGGVLWFGTHDAGINRWNPMTWSFAHYRADPRAAGSLSSNAVFAFSEDAEGKLWIGTFGGGLDVLDRANGTFEHLRHDPADPASLPSDQVSALRHDRRGVLWVGTAGGGLGRTVGPRADVVTSAFRTFRHDPEDPGSLSEDTISALYQDRAGDLWIGTFRGGLNRLRPESETFVRFRHDPARPDSLSDDTVNAFAEDAEGRLWVGTFGGGLNRLERLAEAGGAAFRRIRHQAGRPASLSNDTVYALHVDGEGTLWAGTHVGLNRLESSPPALEGAQELGEEAVFRHYFERDGLASDVVYGILSDDESGLWLSTNDGLSRLDRATGTFKTYRMSHGLQGDEFNFGASYRSRSGELFFGGTGGFNAFYPDRIESNAAVPPVVMTSFAKLGQPLAFGRPAFDVEELELGHRDDLFSVEFAALDFTAPEENRYRYRLEGLNDAWVDLGTRRRVTFTDLAPGRYVLRVQGSNNDGVWNEEGAAVRIVVRPPFWKAWWFRLVGFLALAGVLWAAHRSIMQRAERRQRRLAEAERAAEREELIARLEAKNTELERFAYTVSHDLKAPLVTIKGFLGFLKRDAAAAAADPAKLGRMARDIDRITAAAAKMHVLLEDLLQLSRVGRQVQEPEEVPFAEIAREAVELVGGQVEERGVEVRLAPDLPVVRGDRARLVEVVQNLLQNAVKYMGDEEAPRVEIGADLGRQQNGAGPTLYVRDNGMGIDPQYQEKVFELFHRLSADVEGTGVGLALVKRIVELHGGRVWVESEGEGRGSTFWFTLGGAPEAPRGR